METRTREKGTIDCRLQGFMGTLDDVNPTRLSKRSQGCPLTMPIMHSSILKSLVKLRSKSMLMCSSPVKSLLLTICPCINHKLLEELSTIEERWLRTVSNMKTIGIVASIRNYLWVSLFFSISLSCILPSFSKLSSMDWGSWMPSILPLWK